MKTLGSAVLAAIGMRNEIANARLAENVPVDARAIRDRNHAFKTVPPQPFRNMLEPHARSVAARRYPETGIPLPGHRSCRASTVIEGKPMTTKRTEDQPPPGNMEKDPDEWVTGNEPMTGAQRSYLKTLSDEAHEPFDENLTKAEASRRIEELQARTGRGREVSKTRQGERSGKTRPDAGSGEKR
jgi:hypothetical protein